MEDETKKLYLELNQRVARKYSCGAFPWQNPVATIASSHFPNQSNISVHSATRRMTGKTSNTEKTSLKGLQPPTPARSRIMAAIRSTGNLSTELRLREILRTHGISGWRRHAKLPGRPDYVFRNFKVAVFVDGCFWHGCPTCYKPPSKNVGFWAAKVRSNRERDQRVAAELRKQGWKVLRIWEHSLIIGEARIAARIKKMIIDTDRKP